MMTPMFNLLHLIIVQVIGIAQWLARDIVLVFLGKTLYSHSVPLHSGVNEQTQCCGQPGSQRVESHPIQGGVEILPIAS